MIPSCPSAFVFLPRCLTFVPLVTVCRSSAIRHSYSYSSDCSTQDLCKTYLLLSVAQPKTSCLLKLWSVYPALRLLGMLFAAHCCGRGIFLVYYKLHIKCKFMRLAANVSLLITALLHCYTAPNEVALNALWELPLLSVLSINNKPSQIIEESESKELVQVAASFPGLSWAQLSCVELVVNVLKGKINGSLLSL